MRLSASLVFLRSVRVTNKALRHRKSPLMQPGRTTPVRPQHPVLKTRDHCQPGHALQADQAFEVCVHNQIAAPAAGQQRHVQTPHCRVIQVRRAPALQVTPDQHPCLATLTNQEHQVRARDLHLIRHTQAASTVLWPLAVLVTSPKKRSASWANIPLKESRRAAVCHFRGRSLQPLAR